MLLPTCGTANLIKLTIYAVSFLKNRSYINIGTGLKENGLCFGSLLKKKKQKKIHEKSEDWIVKGHASLG